MGRIIDPYKIWAQMKMKTWPERHWLVDMEASDIELAGFIVSKEGPYACLLRDQAGLTAVVDEETFSAFEGRSTPRNTFGPFKIVSTDSELPFDVMGFLQPLLLELNSEGVKAGPQCGAVFDHLFIYEEDIERAEAIIGKFIADARVRAN